MSDKTQYSKLKVKMTIPYSMLSKRFMNSSFKEFNKFNATTNSFFVLMIFSIFFEFEERFLPAPNINMFLSFNNFFGSKVPWGLLEIKYAKLINL